MRTRLKNTGVRREQEDIVDYVEWTLNTLEQELTELHAFLQAAAAPSTTSQTSASAVGSSDAHGIIASIFGGLQRETLSVAGCEMSCSDSAFKIVRVQILDDGVTTLEQALLKTFRVELIGA